MKNRFDLLIFDWDGTLVDSIAWIVHCIEHAARTCDCPLPAPERSRSVIGLRLDQALEQLFPNANAATRDGLIRAYQSEYRSRPATPADFFDGVERLLPTLIDAGYTLAVATGKTRAGLRRAIEGTGSGALFSATRCADETASKPDPLMLFQLMEETAAAPERTVMIGDSVHDLQMARQANIEAIAVSCGANTEDELARLSPLLCLPETAHLRDLLL